MSYLASLSGRQRFWLIGTLAAMAGLVAVGWLLEPEPETTSVSSFTTEMTIRQIAPQLGSTGAAMARELGMPLGIDKDTPLEELGVEQAKLDHVVEHLLGHRATNFKYYLYGALVLWGLVFLTQLGRPDGSANSDRKTWYPRAPYVVALLAAVAVCGFALGKSPNPMEGGVKVFKSMVGLYPSVAEKLVALLFFLGLAVVGNKLVCGWACPFGALQELLYSLPGLKHLKRRKVPFWISNLIRGGLFVVVLLFLFGLVGGRRGFVIYHFINPFNLFNLEFFPVTILLTVAIVVVLAPFVYRPFCQFICPFGLLSWLAERVSLVRVRVDPARCTGCGACIRACPLEAAKHKVEGKFFAADCYSCARCLNVCPEEALAYRCVFGKSSPSPEVDLP